VTLTEESIDEQVEDLAFHLTRILATIAPGLYDQPMDQGEEWKEQAACKGKTDLFFPKDIEGSTRANTDGYREARKICAICPVRPECAEAGKSERAGLWGGLSENERHPKHRGVGA
jgi:WhiB family redox-sensing transcriptional regulator